MYVTTVDTAASTSDMNNIAFRLCAMGYQSIHVTSQRTGNNETKAYPTIRICLLITLTGDCLSRNAQTSYAKCPLWVINPKPSKGKGDDAECRIFIPLRTTYQIYYHLGGTMQMSLNLMSNDKINLFRRPFKTSSETTIVTSGRQVSISSSSTHLLLTILSIRSAIYFSAAIRISSFFMKNAYPARFRHTR